MNSLSKRNAQRKKFRLPILPLFFCGLLLAALILLGFEFFRFTRLHRNLASSLPTDTTVADIPVSNLTVADAVKTWENLYSQPVQLDLAGNPIQLLPAAIGFQINSAQMESELKAKSAGTTLANEFWRYLWQQQSTEAVTIPLESTYDQDKLKAFLNDIGQRYAKTDAVPNFDMNTMTFSGSTDSRNLDVEASLPLIEAALRRPTDRKVQLVTKKLPGRAADITMLRQAILDYMKTKSFSADGPDTYASVMLIDLKNGQEMNINPAVAYSTLSTVKIPIMLNMFRVMDKDPNTAADPSIKWLMGASIMCSMNEASNSLLAFAGSGSTKRDQQIGGLTGINSTMEKLGAKNTFMTAPIAVGPSQEMFSIPAPKTSPDRTYNTQPDNFSQTTAEDMANLLQEIYQCSEYGSGLAAILPESYTQSECKEMVELLSGNVIGRMIELGVPAGTRVAHKNGWGRIGTGFNSSDAAIVYTPGGNYILVLYMWEKLKEGYEVGSINTWETMEGVSRIVYNYFNPSNPLLASRQPANPNTAIDCVMPDPNHPETLDFTNIKNGRFDDKGNILPSACVGYPRCTNQSKP